MSTTTSISPRMVSAQPLAVGDALREFASAAQRVLRALSAALSRQEDSPSRPLAPCEEAQQVRNMADRFVRTDPGFAADLFAAADRHERAHAL